MVITQQQLQARKQGMPKGLMQRLGCVWGEPRYHDNGHVVIQPITCLDGNLEMEFRCSTMCSSYRPRLKIKSYFFSSRKDKQRMPVRREIFQAIDELAQALGAEYAYIDQDTHNYRAKHGGHRISSRYLDPFLHQKTFYQRGWTGSFRMTSQQYRSLSQIDRAKVVQGHQANRRTIVDLFQQISIRDICQLLPPHNQGWVRTHFPEQDLPAYALFEKAAHDILENEDDLMPILVFQEALHKILNYDGPDQRFRLLRDNLDQFFHSTRIVKIYQEK